MEHMSNNERKIYDLVVRRFISVLYPAFEYEQTTLKAEAKPQVKHLLQKERSSKPPDGRPYMPMLHLPVPLLHSMMLTGIMKILKILEKISKIMICT